MKNKACYLDVELRYPSEVGFAKGRSVRPLKSYMIWVHSVAKQEGFYLQLNNKALCTKGIEYLIKNLLNKLW